MDYQLETLTNVFLAALEAGLPNASGVALGVDRLIMVALGCEKINEVDFFCCGNA